MPSSMPPRWPHLVSIPCTEFDTSANLNLDTVGQACSWDAAAIARTLETAGIRPDDAGPLARYAVAAHGGLGMAAADELPLHLRARLT